jgi:hypothetical protein
MSENTHYRLSIADSDHLQRGVHRALLFYNKLELVFFENEKEIKRASLSPDPVSFHNTLVSTQAKITLMCKRLGIDENTLEYDKSPLKTPEKLAYKGLFIAQMLYKMFIPMQWVIAYKDLNKAGDKWHKIIPPKEVFQADPFILYKDGKHYVFYEELKFADYHGYLAVAELDTKHGKLSNAKTILKLDYHLSYPQVFEEDGRFYMIPESAENHTVDLFECTSFPYEWNKKQTLLDNIQAVDSTLLKTNDSAYLFTSEKVDGANFDDELSIYKSENLFSKPFKKLYQQPVISDVCNARMAGKFMQKGADIYRIAQDCGKRYGYRANINKVIQIEDGYKEEKQQTIDPGSGALGFHTYNEAHGIAVADMLIARFDFYSLKRFIGGNLKRVLFSD